jgi:hypothetical protein
MKAGLMVEAANPSAAAITINPAFMFLRNCVFSLFIKILNIYSTPGYIKRRSI